MNRSGWLDTRIIQWLARMWHHLVDADDDAARQLAAVSIVLSISMLLGLIAQIFWLRDLLLPAGMIAGMYVGLAVVYGFSRTRLHRAGVVLLFIISYGYGMYTVVMNHYAGYLALLGIPVLLVIILIKGQKPILITLGMTSLSMLLIMLSAWLLDYSPQDTYSILAFVGISGMVLSVLQWAHLSTLEALRASEMRYRQMFENNHTIQMVIDPRTTAIREANSAAAEFYGYPEDVLTTMYARDINLLPQEQIKERIALVLAGKGDSFRFRHRLAAGEIRHVRVSISPVDMAEGRMLYVIVQDITGQHYAELRYRALFSQSRDAIFILNLDGSRIEINPRASELLGYDHGGWPEIDYRSTVTWDEQHQAEEVLRRLKAGEDVEPYERTFQRKEGTLVHTEVSATLVRDDDGTPLHLQSVARDITERKLAELALRASEARLKSVVDTQSDLICRVRADMVMTFVNDAFCRFFDRGPADLIGSSLLDMVLDEERADIQRNFEAMITSTIFREYEATMSTRAGETRHLIWLMTPVKNKVGRSDEYQLVGSDITERKSAMEQQFALALEQERSRLLTQFIQDAAHEFRTPLAVINSSTYLMQHTTSTERPRHYWAKQITGQVQRLTRLVDMLLTMTQLESSSASLDATIEVYGFLKSVCDAARSGREDAAKLACLGAPVVPVRGNQKLLSEAFGHLLDNAYHFTPSDGRIEVSVKEAEGRVWVDICDNGFGISPGSMPNVFDTFWREDMMHSSPGFGLGLPIARRIIEQHNGQITIRSEPDTGTCVTVLLPAAPAAQHEPGPR